MRGNRPSEATDRCEARQPANEARQPARREAQRPADTKEATDQSDARQLANAKRSNRPIRSEATGPRRSAATGRCEARQRPERSKPTASDARQLAKRSKWPMRSKARGQTKRGNRPDAKRGDRPDATRGDGQGEAWQLAKRSKAIGPTRSAATGRREERNRPERCAATGQREAKQPAQAKHLARCEARRRPKRSEANKPTRSKARGRCEARQTGRCEARPVQALVNTTKKPSWVSRSSHRGGFGGLGPPASTPMGLKKRSAKRE
jgi:hypothetical protein